MSSFRETKTRSLIKTIIWKVIATLITWLSIYLFTGALSQSTKITAFAAALGMIAYYIHERVWGKVSWGKEVQEQ